MPLRTDKTEAGPILQCSFCPHQYVGEARYTELKEHTVSVHGVGKSIEANAKSLAEMDAKHVWTSGSLMSPCTVCGKDLAAKIHDVDTTHPTYQPQKTTLHMEAPHSAGRKDDLEKLRWDLLPAEAVEAMVEVLTYGAKKYTPENWRKVPDWRWRYFAAAMRHLWAWKRGQKRDPESGKLHLAHAMCCIAFLLELDHE